MPWALATAYLDGVQPARRSPARAARRPPGSAASPPGSTHVAGQGIPQLLGMPGVQVDLVLRAVQAETDGSFGGTAVKIIDEQGLYLLSHGRSSPLTDRWRTSVCSSSRTSVQPRRELSRFRPAPADAALAGSSVPLRSLTVISLQAVPADVDGLLPPGLVTAFRARLHDLVAERYCLSEFLHSACNRTSDIRVIISAYRIQKI